MTISDGRDRHRNLLLAWGGILGLLVLAGWLIMQHTSASTAGDSASPQPSSRPASASPPSSRATDREGSTAQRDLRKLRSIAPAKVADPPDRITGELTHQPDLYAAEFVRRLLTQDYRTSRQSHLAWVQAESAQTTEPLVVGLVPPELRDRIAMYSVSDASGGPAPVPDEREWNLLGRAGSFTTVQIQRVNEPLAWTNAVADGRITDPGATGREVAALVTRHTSGSGVDHSQRFSVDIALNLEGPPTRATWGFVAAVTYVSIPIGAP